jgi:tRNA (guanosine-2'-O-)-methyltransferase
MVQNRQRDLVIVLEDIHDPHNAEAVFRTCDAFGVQTAHLIFETQRLFNPRKVGKSTSSSANKWLDFVTHRSTADALTHLKSEGYTIVGTTLQPRSISIYDADFSTGKIAILVGNEHRGLSETAHQFCDVALTIPMAGLVQSLNLSVTCALVLYEVSRQRHPNKAAFTLDATQQSELLTTLSYRSRRRTLVTKVTPGSVPLLGKFGGDK